MSSYNVTENHIRVVEKSLKKSYFYKIQKFENKTL